MSNINLVWDPNTPPEALERLSYDKDSSVRYYVACNPNTPPEALERLSYDKDGDVRYVVAQISNAPQYIKDLLKFKRYLKYYDFT